MHFIRKASVTYYLIYNFESVEMPNFLCMNIYPVNLCEITNILLNMYLDKNWPFKFFFTMIF